VNSRGSDFLFGPLVAVKCISGKHLTIALSLLTYCGSPG
jgi:hypothetical protein